MLIALGGYEKAGKDTAADILVAECGFTKTYMSEPLERALVALNPWIAVETSEARELATSGPLSTMTGLFDLGPSSIHAGPQVFVRYADIHAAIGYTESKRIAGVVEMLQRLGTEVGRNILGRDTWLRVAQELISREMADGNDVIITGIRYPNELRAMRQLGGVSYWVSRSGRGPVNDHSSANTLTALDFDGTLTNDGTVDDLRTQVLALADRS